MPGFLVIGTFIVTDNVPFWRVVGTAVTLNGFTSNIKLRSLKSQLTALWPSSLVQPVYTKDILEFLPRSRGRKYDTCKSSKIVEPFSNLNSLCSVPSNNKAELVAETTLIINATITKRNATLAIILCFMSLLLPQVKKQPSLL